LKNLTKKELLEIIKLRDHQIADAEAVMEAQQEEVEFLKDALRQRGARLAESSDFEAPEDGTMSCQGLELFVKAGSTGDDMNDLMEAGEKMIEWLEKKGIELSGKGASESN